MTTESLFSDIGRACGLMRSDGGTPKRQQRGHEQGSKMTPDELLHLIA
jgi:hypothetical protein